MRLSKPAKQTHRPQTTRWKIFVIVVLAVCFNVIVGHRMLTARLRQMPMEEPLGEEEGGEGEAPEEVPMTSRAEFMDAEKGTVVDLAMAKEAARRARHEEMLMAVRKRIPWKGKGKKPMPYDIDRPANWSVLEDIRFGPDFGLIMSQETMLHESFRRPDNMEYYTVTQVPRNVQEDEEEGGDDTEKMLPDKNKKKMRKLVYRIPDSIYRQLPSNEPDYHFKECAVVGNSGNLLASTYGAEIDQADAVLRINNAPVQHFEKHVGKKTTFNMVNQAHAKMLATMKDHHLHPNATVMVYESGHAAVRLRIFPKLIAVLGKDSAAMLSPSFIVRGYSLWLSLKALVEEVKAESRRSHNNTAPVNFKRKPMTGFFGTLFCAQFCERVSLYGFSPWRPHQRWAGSKSTRASWAPYHYFDTVPGSTAVHSFDLSIEVFKLMGRSVNLRVMP